MKIRLAVLALFVLLFFRGSAQYGWAPVVSIDEVCCIRHFYWPAIKPGERVLLYFDDIDWPFVIYVNGKLAGRHGGGNGPFSMDITDKIKQGDNEIIIPMMAAGNHKRAEDIWARASIR